MIRSERHWSVYLPALSISILWAGILFWADRHEPPLETLRLLALAVEAIAVPALYLWAYFRARGAFVLVDQKRIAVSTGGRTPEKVDVDLTSIEEVQVAQSYLQRFVGAGRIAIRLADGRQFALDDMGSPTALADAVQKELEQMSKAGAA